MEKPVGLMLFGRTHELVRDKTCGGLEAVSQIRSSRCDFECAFTTEKNKH